jgi:hypothetical protein
MARNMKKLIVLMLILINSSLLMAQFGLSGGMTVLKGFNAPKPFVGFHIGGEIPRDDQLSFYGRLSFLAKQSESIKTVATLYDPTFTSSTELSYRNSMNYTILEGGNRYYIGNGYDSGFGAYGGGKLLLIFNSVKRKYDSYDQVKFPLPDTEFPKGSIFNIAVGLGGGIKNTFSGIGTVYLDAGLSYMIMSTGSNATAESVGLTLYSPLIFTFNLGFRKDLY